MKRTDSDLRKHIDRCSSCRKQYLVGLTDNHDVILLPVRCKSYFCPSCASLKKWILTKQLDSFFKRKTIRFLTLTYSTELYSDVDVIKRQQSDFNKFITYIRRKYNYKFQYFKMIEFTKKGYIHFHILIDSYISNWHISKEWKAITGSYITWISRPRNHKHCKSYVLKYITKSIKADYSENYYLYNIKRYTFSKIMNIQKKAIECVQWLKGLISEYTAVNPDYVASWVRLQLSWNLIHSPPKLNLKSAYNLVPEDVLIDMCFS